MSDEAPNRSRPDGAAIEQPSAVGLLAWLPWIAAAGFAVAAGYLGQKYLSARSELVGLNEQYQLGKIESQSLRQQLEAERIISARRLSDLSADSAGAIDPAGLDFLFLHGPAAGGQPASALVMWSPKAHRGLLMARRLPPLKAGRDYQLWVAGPPQPAPGSVGVFSADAAGEEIRFPFRIDDQVTRPVRFLVTIAPKGGETHIEGPVVLTSQ